MSKLPKYATPEIKFTKRPLPKVEIKKKPSLKKSQLQFKKRGINRSEHWYKAMVENMQNSVWVSDEGIKVFYVNPSLCKLLGYSAEEIIGKSEYDFWSKETAEKVKRVVATDRKEGISSSYEGELVTKSGEKIPVLVLGTPLPGGGTVGILTDLRNVKKNEKALADSEKKYRAIFENTGTATVIIEEDFTISLVNSEFEYISGCSRAQLEGKKEWTEFFVKEDVKKMMRYHRLRRTANGGVPRNYEARFIDSKGNVRNTFLTVSMIPGTKKSVASILDITEHIQLEKELTQRESELSLITKSSLDVIFILTKNGKVAYASPASKEMLGFKPEEIVGASLAKFVSAKDLKKCWKALKDVFRNKKITNLQIDIKDRNGSFTPVEISGQLIEKDGEFCAQGTMRNIQKRKEAEMALKESEEKYRSMIDQSMVGICMLQGTKLIFANKKLANIFGRSNADELIGKDVKKCLTEDSFNLVKKVISAMYRNEKVPELGEYVGIKKNGKQINLQTFSKRIEIQGKIYVQVFVIDATEKKIMETKLAERIKEINVLYRVYSHIKMAQPLAHTLSYITRDIIHAFQFMDVVQARIVFDGKTYTSSKKKENFVHKIEKPIIVAGVKRGILQVGYLKSLPAMEKVPFWPEERKLVETTSQILGKHIRSREVLERHKKIVTKSITGIYIATDGILRYVNPRFCKIFKYSKNEVLGKPIHNFLSACSCENNVLKRTNLSSFHCSTKGKQKGKTSIDLDVVMQRIDHHGQEAILGRVHDVTLLKEAERRLKGFNEELKKTVAEKTQHLEEANKRLQSLNEMKDEFIAVTSHELRSPLTSVRGYLSFLVEKESLEELPEPIQQYLLRAYHNTESLNYLVNNILDVSRLEMGRFDLQLNPTDLIQLTKSTIDGVSFQIDEKKLKINFRNLTSSKKLMLKLDDIRISQVLRNLLDNAIKFSRIGKAITVKLRKTKHFAVVEIVDQGVGIPKAKIEQIFDKFIQVKDVDTRYKGGAGLGLFIAKRIIELHCGTIDAESRKRHGTKFTLKLPLSVKKK